MTAPARPRRAGAAPGAAGAAAGGAAAAPCPRAAAPRPRQGPLLGRRRAPRRAPPPPAAAGGAAAEPAAAAAAAGGAPPPGADPAEYAAFAACAARGNLVPLFERLMGDHLTPVLAYRSLVARDDRAAPSFLFESVVGGDRQGRFSFVGARPAVEVVARGGDVEVVTHPRGGGPPAVEARSNVADPMAVPAELSAGWRPAPPPGLPAVFTGGWVGFAGYDTVRYVYGSKLPFSAAPRDDRGLPDLHLARYDEAVVFDHATKLVYLVAWVHLGDHAGVPAAYAAGRAALAGLAAALAPAAGGAPRLAPGRLGSLDLGRRPEPSAAASNVSRDGFLGAIAAVKEHIQAGDVFQLVLSQRFERRTRADPFDVYRALRVVNPSPYMAYLQARGAILVASSPEILCRVGEDGVVTNRPLAGTRPRGADARADAALEAELLADEKERAEHVMLVDLGRNDVGRVAAAGTVAVQRLMEVERYSHVMHISSTVTGRLAPGLTAWDALRAALPAGTVSGAPKVRAMQIIDALEPARRGPYGGGFGVASFTGGLDMALALRTMVVPNPPPGGARGEWTVHLQAGAGVVADSVPEAEYEETVNKAAALGRAIDLAEAAFGGGGEGGAAAV